MLAYASVFKLFVRGRLSLWSLHWPGTWGTDEAGFQLTGIYLPATLCFLRQGLSLWPRLAENSLHSLGWSRTRGPPPHYPILGYKLELAHPPIDPLFFDYKSWNKIPKSYARHVLNFESR